MSCGFIRTRLTESRLSTRSTASAVAPRVQLVRLETTPDGRETGRPRTRRFGRTPTWWTGPDSALCGDYYYTEMSGNSCSDACDSTMVFVRMVESGRRRVIMLAMDCSDCGLRADDPWVFYLHSPACNGAAFSASPSYHMYGAGTGTLEVTPYKSETPVWNKTGEQSTNGEDWIEGVVEDVGVARDQGHAGHLWRLPR